MPLAGEPVRTGLPDTVDLVLFGTCAGAALLAVALSRGLPGARR